MKKIILPLLLMLVAAGASAQGLGDLLNGLAKGKSDKGDATEQTSTSGLGNALGSILGNIIGNDKVSPADLVGTWKYSAPAVAFESDNFLQKAGGAAAAATIEKKLEPYYKKAGVTQMTFIVEADSSFVMQLPKGKLSGTLIRSDRDGFMTFNFKVAGLKIGKMDAAVTKTGSHLTICFDVSKLMSIVNAAAKVSSNSMISGANKLLQSYDGVQAGFAFNKTTDTTQK